MAAIDPRIDEYIAKSADFAKPILNHIRQIVHTACPGVTETMKWSFPHFMYAGSILCSMAAFKQHCAFSFWLGAKMKDTANILEQIGERTSMGHLGTIKSLKDLPSDKIFFEYLQQAMKLNEEGVKNTQPGKVPKPKDKSVPQFLTKALAANNAALAFFSKLSDSKKYEYVEWLNEAKTEATREKRLATTIEWLSEAKTRNWKYERK